MKMSQNIENLIGRQVRIPEQFAEPVVVESFDVIDDETFALRVKTLRGQNHEITLSYEEIESLLNAQPAQEAVRFADPSSLFLLIESARIRQAYAWDPYFAVSLSGIEALPHQLEAVYDRMLPQARLRFLLADDPGAGKTIMAGLLLKELRLRGAVERTLILAPAALALQWQDELRVKFDEHFELIQSVHVREQLGGSPWARFPQCVASIDFAKQEHIASELLRERWDLVIIDEAHKVSMPNQENPTMRYRLARELAERTERLLLLTATPHQGNPQQFQNLLALLDEHAFSSADAVQRLLNIEKSPWILRRMKEDLRDFNGLKLFVKRHAYTEDFALNDKEWDLYQAVTEYINQYLPKQSGRSKQTAALARMVLQRRLASSLRAIRVSIERRHKRLSELVVELTKLTPSQRNERLQQLALLTTDAEQDDDDASEADLDKVTQDAIATSQRFDLLQTEVTVLSKLLAQAMATEVFGDESKLNKLFGCLEYAHMQSLKEQGGKLIIFTEQRATLEYLLEHLERRGYVCCQIHGGMDALARKAAQDMFRREAQICVATDAAGEGINLQFCHLMVNYDLPWNPTRLEQRMGRIHRFGQKREVHVFNFVAISGPLGPSEQPVVEGRVLQRLLDKLNEIKSSMGDRVFDIIGLLLKTNKISLEEVLRDATYNPRLLDDYVDDIQHLSKEKLEEYERTTGIALANRTVDLSKVRGTDFESEEKRLMPEYVEDFLMASAQHVGLKIERRHEPHMLRIPYVSQKFSARTLSCVRRYGEPKRSYPKASFRKQLLMQAQHTDGELLSPGHPLYAAVDEVLNLDLRDVRGACACYMDPRALKPYRLYFFDVEVEGEMLDDPGQPPTPRIIHASLVAVQEDSNGQCVQSSPDLLHDLTPWPPETPIPNPLPLQAPSPDDLRSVELWTKAKIQKLFVSQHQVRRAQESEMRREFLSASFKASIATARKKYMELSARVAAGDEDTKFARNNAQARVKELEETRDHRLKVLDHLRIARAGRIARIGSVLVLPAPPSAGVGARMYRDEEVERIAMQISINYEESRGWTVTDVSKLGDGSGFDLRSVSPPDANGKRDVRRIEVKGRAQHDVDVQLTPNEWRQAQRLGDTYWLYVVWGCKTATPALKTIQDPWKQFNTVAKEVVELKGHLIPAGVLGTVLSSE